MSTVETKASPAGVLPESVVAGGAENSVVVQPQPAVPAEISQLSPLKQATYRLYQEGKTYNEIGAVINRSSQTVAAHIAEFRQAGIPLVERRRGGGGRPKGSVNKTQKSEKAAPRAETKQPERRTVAEDLKRALDYAQSFGSLDRALNSLNSLRGLLTS